MNIVFSANNFKEVIKLPIVPDGFLFQIPRNNEDFETVSLGTINLIGLRGLKTVSISSFFPNKVYSYAKSKVLAGECVNFFNKWANRRVPIRIIVTNSNDNEVLNMACTVENFEYGLDKAGDVPYTLELKEFKFVAVK